MKMNWYIRGMQNIFLRRLFLVITGSKINAGEGDKNMADYIKGVDLSVVAEVEELGAKYYDNGVQGDIFDILKNYGVNSVRLRLWNDPYTEDGVPYGAGTNDLEVYKKLSKRAMDHGMSILLDYHYSDFWADPGKQRVPKAWRGMDADQLEQAVYDYTRETLLEMKDAGVLPQLVQVGNELTNGLMWPLGQKPEYDNIAKFVSAGIRAVRSVDSDIPVMIHLDNGGNNPMYVDWFDHYMERGENFDIIGMSYYPFWHGTMKELETNMRDMADRYGKKIVIAEVSMGFTMEDYADYEKLGPDDRKGYATKPSLVENLDYPMTPEGQAEFMNDIMKLIDDVPGGDGFYYWEAGWIPVPGSGWATEGALSYIDESGPCGNEWANQALFDYDGHALPALKTIRDYKPAHNDYPLK